MLENRRHGHRYQGAGLRGIVSLAAERPTEAPLEPFAVGAPARTICAARRRAAELRSPVVLSFRSRIIFDNLTRT